MVISQAPWPSPLGNQLSQYKVYLIQTTIKPGKYENCHLVLKGSFWFFLVLFLVLFSSYFGSLVLFSVFFILVLQVLSELKISENQSHAIPVTIL